jgi:hypothetical protein
MYIFLVDCLIWKFYGIGLNLSYLVAWLKLFEFLIMIEFYCYEIIDLSNSITFFCRNSLFVFLEVGIIFLTYLECSLFSAFF